MSVRLTVHRATREIGGNCIEIVARDGTRIILDVGRPLDVEDSATGLLPATLDLVAPAAALLISHPHQDHYGLLAEVPAGWPVICGAATARLIVLTSGIVGTPISRAFRNWTSGERLEIGPFGVTPYLTDHSAFDAYMLLIEVDGRRILYSGDFRSHGRKSKLVARMMASPPADVDVLLMEGTNLGSDKSCITEDDLEAEFAALFRTTPGRVFVAWSAQNVDRTVTLYRACRKTGRTLVVDLYTAEVLETLVAFGKLPQPHWPGIKVVVTSAFARMYRKKGEAAFVDRMAIHGIAARALAGTPDRWVAMVRSSLLRDYARGGVAPGADDAWCWSMWRGYLDRPDGSRMREWFPAGGARPAHLHTSGHAAPHDLRAFAKSIAPKWLVPIHGADWHGPLDGFPPIRRLGDGEPLKI